MITKLHIGTTQLHRVFLLNFTGWPPNFKSVHKTLQGDHQTSKGIIHKNFTGRSQSFIGWSLLYTSLFVILEVLLVVFIHFIQFYTLIKTQSGHFWAVKNQTQISKFSYAKKTIVEKFIGSVLNISFQLSNYSFKISYNSNYVCLFIFSELLKE